MLQPKAMGTNSSEIKLHNMSAILMALLRNKTLSRVGLSQIVGVSTATITNLVSELVEQGLVAEVGLVKNNGQVSVGRPQKALRLIPDARYAVGVHIDVENIYITLTNIQCEIVQSQSIEHHMDTPWHQVMNQVGDVVNELISQQGLTSNEVVGVGVAASGLVNPLTGVNVIAPNLGWHDVPIQDYLHGRLNIPIIVENNVRAMALGEALFGVGRDTTAMAFIYGRIGVGAGLVVDGQIYRGAGAGAGEVGHTLLLFGDHDSRTVHSLESLVSKPALLKAARKLVVESPQSLLADYVDDLTLDAVFRVARVGDSATVTMLEQRAFYLGIALANLVNVFNPELIVLGGIFAQAYDLMMPTAEQTLRDYAFADLGANVVLQTTSFDYQSGMIGAAALALDHFFYRPQTMMKIN